MGTSTKDWPLIVIGILMVVCGFVIWLTPVGTLVAITMLAGAGFLVAGVIDIIEYVRMRTFAPLPGWTLLYAVLDIVIGILMLAYPVVLAGMIPWLVGFGIIVFGAFEAFAAMQARKMPGVPWGWMLFSAIVDIVCGISFMAFPAMLALFVALFAIMRGATLVVFGVVGRRGLM